MSEHTLYSSLIRVEKGNKESLLKALEQLSDFDLDFNGANGIEYAWNETIEAGFESNMEYLIDKVKDIENDIECVITFVDEWMESDKDYYYDYELQYLADNDGMYAISLSVVTGY